MRVVVLGAGVIGVTSAYYLRKAGHEVTLIDRQPGPALETSFANAGEISPGYASPWAAPGIPRKALKWIFMRHAPLILHPVGDLDMWRWMFSLLGNCSSAKYAINKARMVRLAEFSRDELIKLRTALALEYDQQSRGTLQLFRTQKQLDGIGKDLNVLDAGNVPYEVMSRQRCIEVEPGLADVAEKVVGGLLLPNDETGDCFKFTAALCDLVQQMGVDFRFGQSVERVILDRDRVSAVSVAGKRLATDTCVVALGSFSPRLVRNLGIRLPIYPVKGYSITVPIVDAAYAPRSTLMDETYKIAITRLGARIRVGGMAEIAGFDRSLHLKRRSTLEHSLHSLFPKAGDLGQASFWSGLRPMTPDGTPIIGATPIAGLYLNTGHGTLGWTMACGSARVLADMISSKTPAIDTSDLSVNRYA